MRLDLFLKRKRLVGSTVAVVSLVSAWLLLFGLPPSLTLSDEERASYNHLVSARYFAGPAVGFAAVEPDESKALRLLAARPHGGTAFKYLVLRGTPAGKLYALVGLRHTNPRFFQVAVQPFRIWPGEVTTMFGCVSGRETMSDVVSNRQDNFGGRMDILGGGYTMLFLEFDELIRPIERVTPTPGKA